MNNLKYRISEDSLIVDYKTLISGEIKTFDIKKIGQESWPTRFFTATSTMRDFIGNVKEIQGGVCSVEGLIYDSFRVVTKVIIADKSIAKTGERVMVTEHLNINGKLELMATKKRVLVDNLNFINIGWSDNKKCNFIRIDAYTGECIKMICSPVLKRLK